MNGDMKNKEEIKVLDKTFNEMDEDRENQKRADARFKREGYRARGKANKNPSRKTRKQKAVVTVSEMKSTCLYVIHGSDDKTLYRREEKGKLEKLSNNNWGEIKVTRQMIMNIKFREY